MGGLWHRDGVESLLAMDEGVRKEYPGGRRVVVELAYMNRERGAESGKCEVLDRKTSYQPL